MKANEGRFYVRAVRARRGDAISGADVGTADDIAGAFALLGQAIARDQAGEQSEFCFEVGNGDLTGRWSWPSR
jgi:hypothetical protein